jgi:hypothetical protein
MVVRAELEKVKGGKKVNPPVAVVEERVEIGVKVKVANRVILF